MRPSFRHGAAQRVVRPSVGGGLTTAKLLGMLVGTLLLVQIVFLFTSQYDLLRSHNAAHAGASLPVKATRSSLFGDRFSRKGAAAMAASLLEAFRSQRDDVVVDGAGFVPIAVQRGAEPSPSRKPVVKLDSDPANPQREIRVSATASKSPAAAVKPAAGDDNSGDGSHAAKPVPSPGQVGPNGQMPKHPLPAPLIPGPAPIPPELKDWTPPWPNIVDSKYAYVTLVSGNSAARHAIAWIQSLLETKTKYPIIVLLSRGGVGSPECQNYTWRREMKLQTHDMRCDRNDTIAGEIVSPKYLAIMEKQGAKLQIIDEIPRTRYTETIAGGRHFSWGMSLNKMVIFNMTMYDKIVFMDSDTIAFKNLDHLFGPEYPMFTAAMTYSCCNPIASPTMSGGFWVVEPSLGWGLKMWQMMVDGKPQYWRNGTLKLNESTGLVVTDEWYLSDLDLVRAAFGIWDHDLRSEAVWPMVHDLRHGYVPGLRHLPQYDGWSDDKFYKSVMDRTGHIIDREGFLTDSPLWDKKAPVWRALDIRYDQCVGHCECLPQRDLKDNQFSVHFSCIPEIIHKASWYENEYHFMEDMWLLGESCTRYYYIEWFYRLLVDAGARLDPPYWNGTTVPIWNTTHDAWVRENKEDYRRRGIQRKY